MLSFCAKSIVRVVPKSLPLATFAMKYTKTHEWIDYDAASKVLPYIHYPKY